MSNIFVIFGPLLKTEGSERGRPWGIQGGRAVFKTRFVSVEGCIPPVGGWDEKMTLILRFGLSEDGDAGLEDVKGRGRDLLEV